MRTYRLCHRVLMIHHFDGETDVGKNCLVRSTDFTYTANRFASFISSVTQTGYQRNGNGYLKRSLPPVEFEYSEAKIQDKVEELDAASLENLPIGLDGLNYQWVDLDGEGISGLLTEQAGAWFYKRNLSPINPIKEDEPFVRAKFAPIERVTLKPNAAIAGGQAQFMDLAGDGQPDLVMLDGPMPGFYEHDDDWSWNTFRPFTSRLNRDTRDPNLKFVDLDGDGHADVLITEHEALTWHPSLAEEGFGPARRVYKPHDEEKGPKLVFADGTQSIYLADFSGDGLTDLVRIRNGEVCYWPNLGYGKFGAKVTMDGSPWFDRPEQFDQRRIRLADIDGSGVTDIIYLHSEGVRIYLNESGNSWSPVNKLAVYPKTDNLSSVTVTDLLGNGTACLVWSSPLPGSARRQMRYVDLMGGQKPHLMVTTKNNLGAETRVKYASSTKFYLQDKYAGKPWITRLSFPVHCVEKVTVTDKWRKTTFTSTYTYHHGYYDGIEREFRGFGRVEQVDVEDFGTFAAGNADSQYITDDLTLYQPPVKTVTWFHTGAFLDRERILSQFQHEYFPNWFESQKEGEQVLGDFKENHLPEPDLNAQDLTAEEWREALRACKGMTLRQEVYELDIDKLMPDEEAGELNIGKIVRGEHVPVKLFSTAYHNCHIRRLQPKAENKHAVFLVTESEAITYHYELDLQQETLTPDPRVAHTLNLRIDEFGNVQQSVAVVYPRIGKENTPLPNGATSLINKLQGELHLAYTETRYTGDVNDSDNYRLRVPSEVLTYELTGIFTEDDSDKKTGDEGIDNRYFTLDELRAYRLSDNRYQKKTPDENPKLIEVPDIFYHTLPNPQSNGLEKRLVEHARTLFFSDNLKDPLPFGKLSSLGLPFENYKLALTTDILNIAFADKITADVQSRLSAKPQSGYLSGTELAQRFSDINTEGQYWMCSGVAGFNADAAAHFYLPERYADPFGNVTTLEYDGKYDLFIKSSTDAMGNKTEVVEFDFRVLAPRQLKDINDNLSEVVFDTLGMPAAVAVKGKGNEGDNLDGFDDALLNPSPATLTDFFTKGDYEPARAKQLLGSATARHLYYFGETMDADGKTVWGAHPACACGIVREQHVAQQPDSPVQSAFEYSDGMGAVIVKKVQAEPEQPSGKLRWIATGKTILNNKGKPVKQYEPYFSAPEVGHRFEEPQEVGVTPVMYYDAPGRLIRTESPDGSYSRVKFSPWHVTSYDQNDTVLEPGNRWYEKKTAPSATKEEKRAAELTAVHANTPSVTFLDSLGREVVSVAHNKFNRRKTSDTFELIEEKYVTFTRLDAEGKPLWMQDARGNSVMQYISPPLPDGFRPFDDSDNFDPQGFSPCYDIAGNLLFQHSMDAGDRWMLNDAAGKPMFTWNSRGFISRVEYDALHRPTELHVTDKAGNYFLAERTIYGETAFGVDEAARQKAKATNHLGRAHQVFDAAGVVTSGAYDFKGNLLQGERQLLRDYRNQVNWAAEPAREDEIFTSRTRYDALNRPIQSIAPHSSLASPPRLNITQPGYNEAGLLERVDVWLNRSDDEPDALLDPATADQHIVKNIDYNAKGQRERIDYGNGAVTKYQYDEQTFRLSNLLTTRNGGEKLQNLSYVYDPVGNITHIQDDALQTIYFNNIEVEPHNDYSYDAIYRLIEATGREHLGQTGKPTPPDASNQFHTNLPHPGDGKAMGRYRQEFTYDEVGNILSVRHRGTNPSQPGWRLCYQYAVDSNRLLSTGDPKEANDPDSDCQSHYAPTPIYPDRYEYDDHGSMSRMSHLPVMAWDFKDQLQATARQVLTDGGTPETTYYVYDSSGQRVRKVTDNTADPNATPTRRQERVYLGGFEFYRECSQGAVAKEVETLHIMDGQRRVALIETKTLDSNQSLFTNNEPLIRFQFANHLGSACLELSDHSAVISYEEFYPYGSTSYEALDEKITGDAKRYRYTGKERDEETGLAYHKARYYACWLGRWASHDGIKDGTNGYQYAQNNPTRFNDLNGTQSVEPLVQNKEQVMFDETLNQIGNRIEGAVNLVLAPDESAQSIFDRVESRAKVYSGYPGYSMPRAYLRALNETLNPFSIAKQASDRSERAGRLGDEKNQVREKVAEAFSLIDAFLLLAGLANSKSSPKSTVEDTSPPLTVTDQLALESLESGGPVYSPKKPAAAVAVDAEGYTGDPVTRVRAGGTPAEHLQKDPHVPPVKEGNFETHEVKNSPSDHSGSRQKDAERTALEYVSRHLPKDANGTVSLAVGGKYMCASCIDVAHQFRATYPGVELRVWAPSSPALKLELFPQGAGPRTDVRSSFSVGTLGAVNSAFGNNDSNDKSNVLWLGGFRFKGP